MVCFAYNDYKTWTNPFEISKYLGAYKSLLKGWKNGLDELKTLNDEFLDETITYLEAAYYSFLEDYNQTKYAISVELNNNEIKAKRKDKPNPIKVLFCIEKLVG